MACYDQLAPRYIKRGYHPVPIAPGTKVPHRWSPTKGFVLLRDWPERPPITDPQPGAGIGLVCGKDIVGLDYDCEGEMFVALRAVLPHSPISKIGHRGVTDFFWGPGWESRKFLINGKVVFEILGVGRQTVIPETIHPETHQPYIWVSGSLLDVIPEQDLPRLPNDIEQRIEKALEPFGFVVSEPAKTSAKSDKTESVVGNNVEFDTLHGELNAFALKNLSRWVPALSLYRCKRRRGPHASYEAVATWRPSRNGRKPEERRLNLRISPLGIRDFGDGRGYSALDLVMAAEGCTLGEATLWLDQQLGWSAGGPEIVINATTEAHEPKQETSESGPTIEETAFTEEPEDKPEPEYERILREAGAWIHGDAPPPAPQCSFERFLPQKGVGMLIGQYGSGKTHIIVDLGVAFATQMETKFAGRKRLRRGGVVIVEFEESAVPIRIACAAKHRGIEGETLPIMTLSGAPPVLIRKKVNANAIKWYREKLGAAQQLFQQKFDLPLAMVGIDPLIDAADFLDENDAAEANRAMRTFDALANELDCIFMINDHAGKDVTRGSRGASSKPGKAHFVLTLPERVADPIAHRTLTVHKVRNQAGNWGADLWFELVEVVTQDGEIVSNLACCWGDEVRGGANEENQGEATDRLPRLQAAALRVLKQLLAKAASALRDQIPRVSLEVWYDELLDQTVIEPDDGNRRRTFKRVKDGLLDRGRIEISGEQVWIPLSG
jgi:hypothetical protein